MTLPDLRFARPAPAITEADIARNVEALGYPDGWTAADDVALMEGLFRGMSLFDIGAMQGQWLQDVEARWLALKAAAGVTHGGVPLDAQQAILRIVRSRAEPGGLV